MGADVILYNNTMFNYDFSYMKNDEMRNYRKSNCFPTYGNTVNMKNTIERRSSAEFTKGDLYSYRNNAATLLTPPHSANFTFRGYRKETPLTPACCKKQPVNHNSYLKCQQSNAQQLSYLFKPGMKDVPQWLKSLRLHKYTALFQTMTYAEMMLLDETELERREVTKGARRKILQNLERLRERSKLLADMETKLSSISNVSARLLDWSLSELRTILDTPIHAERDCGVNNNNTKNDLQSHIIRILSLLHKSVLNTASPPTAIKTKNDNFFEEQQQCREQSTLLADAEDEHLIQLTQIYERILSHEAFTSKQKAQIVTYRNALRLHIETSGIRSKRPMIPNARHCSLRAQKQPSKNLSYSRSFCGNISSVESDKLQFGYCRRTNSSELCAPNQLPTMPLFAPVDTNFSQLQPKRLNQGKFAPSNPANNTNVTMVSVQNSAQKFSANRWFAPCGDSNNLEPLSATFPSVQLLSESIPLARYSMYEEKEALDGKSLVKNLCGAFNESAQNINSRAYEAYGVRQDNATHEPLMSAVLNEERKNQSSGLMSLSHNEQQQQIKFKNTPRSFYDASNKNIVEEYHNTRLQQSYNNDSCQNGKFACSRDNNTFIGTTTAVLSDTTTATTSSVANISDGQLSLAEQVLAVSNELDAWPSFNLLNAIPPYNSAADSYSYTSSSGSSDRSSGAGSPMVYNFFEDLLPQPQPKQSDINQLWSKQQNDYSCIKKQQQPPQQQQLEKQHKCYKSCYRNEHNYHCYDCDNALQYNNKFDKEFAELSISEQQSMLNLLLIYQKQLQQQQQVSATNDYVRQL